MEKMSMSVTALGILKIPTITRNWWRIEMENNHIFIKYDEGKVILCENNNVITTIYCSNRDIDDVFFVLKNIVAKKDGMFVDATDIKIINSGKTVRVTSATAIGEECIVQVFQKAFLNLGVIQNSCMLLLIDNDVPLNALVQFDKILDDETVFGKDGTIIWNVSYSEKSGKTAKLIAIIFS